MKTIISIITFTAFAFATCLAYLGFIGLTMQDFAPEHKAHMSEAEITQFLAAQELTQVNPQEESNERCHNGKEAKNKCATPLAPPCDPKTGNKQFECKNCSKHCRPYLCECKCQSSTERRHRHVKPADPVPLDVKRTLAYAR